MTRPAVPGPRLGGGRIRVDAARAIAKLREYQLVERAAWVLEGIRSAVAASATDIVLAGDANDIWLSWGGEPWPAEDLTRLFDELVSPEAASKRHHLRLLAAAVNSGLGLAPAYVDVIAVHDDKAIRARYTPDVLDDPGADVTDSPLRNMTTETIPVPDGARRGMRVHLRRRASIEVLSYLFGEPPELEIARRACADIPVALTIGANRYHRTEHARDVVRVPLGDGLDGFLAIADPDAKSDAIMEVAERGVALARYSLALPDVLPTSLPIRLLIDAPRMPTNASRSQVQRGSHPIAAAEQRVPELVPKLFEQLIARLGAEDLALRDHTAALALLAASVLGTSWWRTHVFASSPLLRALAQLPLLRDATGTRRSLLSRWSGLVYRGREPLDSDLAPWVEDILWVPPDDPAERLIAGAYQDQRALRQRLRAARRQRRDHERFFAHAPRVPTVIAKTLPLHRMRLGAELPASCVPQEVFVGLAGEVCIHAGDDPSEFVVLHHGREIERIGYASPVRFEAVIDAPAITPAARFRGVVRDLEYTRIERAMRAGVLRAVEAIATTDGHSPALIQAGLVLARALGATLGPPLASAPAWRSVDGGYLAHVDLADALAIGVVEPGIDVMPVSGRRLLRCDQGERSRLSGSAPDLVQIMYGPATARPADPYVLASRLAQSTTFALAITDETRAGAIAPVGPGETATITLHHRGVVLSTAPYRHVAVPCAILVDSDTIVPNAAWNRILDEGSAAGSYLAWELALARAAARALVGDRPLELIGPRDVDVHGTLGRTLCTVLAGARANELLGTELLALVRAKRMWSVLGDPDPQSVDQLRASHPAMIPYVGRSAAPVAGFSPLVADDLTASAVATLAGLPVREASLELETRRHAEVRAKHLAKHREKPVQRLALSGETVEIAGPIVRGVVGVGVGSMAMEIRVLVEGRPFRDIRRDGRLPLRAVVEIDAARTMPAFDGIPDDVTEEILTRVTEAAPALLLAVAAARPHALGDRGPARMLLAECALVGELPAATATALYAAPIFVTVQGGRTSIAAARRPYIAITSWSGEWLARENDPPHDCDAPIIVTDLTNDLRTILQRLHGGEIVDVTDEVVKLQRTRRMARGLMPKPTVQGVASELKRSLDELGDIGAALGPGEIALVDDDASAALLHVGGELRKVVPIQVSPSIQIAIEAPDLIDELDRDVPLQSVLHQLRALQLDSVSEAPQIQHAQELAIRLTREILSNVSFDALGPLIRRNLVHAMFRGVLEPAALANVPVFETTIPSWIFPAAVDHQIALFGNVWSIPYDEPASLPLDDRRVVLRIDRRTMELALERGVAIIDAREELALDAQARRNRDKPLATTLALSDARHFLAQITLDGDGLTSPRGVVGILHPAASHLRGLYAHREMRPFNVIRDTATWPVMATLDDARFDPDRTWDRPVDDAVWRSARDAVRDASTRAFTELVKPPEDALAVLRLRGHGLGAWIDQLRGALWIAGPPLARPSLHLVTAAGTRYWAPSNDTGVTGVIYAHTIGNDVLETLCELAHITLVKAMLRGPGQQSVIAAHVAHALALRRISAEDAADVSFACFRPKPFSAADLASLFADTRPVRVVARTDSHPGIVDDGEILSRVVIHHLHDRLRRPSARTASAAPPAPSRHRLQPVLDAIRARFAQLGLDAASARFADRASPMFEHDRGLVVAGDHPRLIALGAALAANSPWASAALDAIVAHGATVLNVALSEVTDATEQHAIGALLDED